MVINIAEQNLREEFQATIREAVANAEPLQIVGGGSKAFYGNASEGEALAVSGHSGVIDYDPAELVITLRACCTLKDVEALLAEHDQMFGFEPPRFSDQATIGGMIASGLSGPRRAFSGAVRDFILGVKIIDGRGDVLNFGGRVIKNVAGFDLSRLMVGAMGTLGVLLEVSLRVIPKHETETTLSFVHDSAEDHIQWINELGGRPLPLSASMWHKGQSLIRLSGSERGVSSAVEKLGGEQGEDVWDQLREQSHSFFSDAASKSKRRLMRISVPPTTHFQLNQDQLIEWGGAQRWLHGDSDLEALRGRVSHLHGSLCVFRGSSEPQPVFQALNDAVLTLHRSLKSKFDPARIFNRDRLYPGL